MCCPASPWGWGSTSDTQNFTSPQRGISGEAAPELKNQKKKTTTAGSRQQTGVRCFQAVGTYQHWFSRQNTAAQLGEPPSPHSSLSAGHRSFQTQPWRCLRHWYDLTPYSLGEITKGSNEFFKVPGGRRHSLWDGFSTYWSSLKKTFKKGGNKGRASWRSQDITTTKTSTNWKTTG